MCGTVYHRTQGTPPFQIARSRDPSDLDIMTSDGSADPRSITGALASSQRRLRSTPEYTWRSALSQARTRDVGMDVHTDAIAVAYVAQDHGAEVVYLGPMGTRHGDIDQLIRNMQSKAKQLLFVYEAGPCGDWCSRALTNKGDVCWVVDAAEGEGI
jgi:hypothetical protein